VQIILGVRHPNLVTGLGSGWCGGRPYLAMEFVAGQSLDKILDLRGVFDEKEALRILGEVTKGLGCVHEHGVIHRDVKPDNVLLGRDGHVKLTDFGLARAMLHARRLTRNGIALGTPDYIAPEQIECSPYADHRVDFYSLGAMYYRLLTGHAPFVAEREQDVMIKHLYDPIPDPRARNPKVTIHSVKLIRKMMAKRPEQRYDNARVLLEDIEAVLRDEDPPHAQASVHKSEQVQQNSRAALVGAACLTGIVFLLFALAKWLTG
jgi:serine/threonine-protein kinase